jgi:hypothetical protein
MIVPGGGIANDGSRWISCKPNFLLRVRVLSKLFQRLMLTKLAEAQAVGRLQFFDIHAHLADAKAFAAFLPRSGRRAGSSIPSARSPAPRPCSPKELVGFTDGARESAQDWRELLLDLKRRGLDVRPELAIADGALGFWKAAGEVRPTTREQRC